MNNNDTFRTYLLRLTDELMKTHGIGWAAATDLIHDELEGSVLESWNSDVSFETCAASLAGAR
jgi:hypothetical protein